MAEKAKRITPLQIRRFLDLLNDLPIVVDPYSLSSAMGSLITLARETKLTIYDASYLELAIEHGISIATADKALKKAAKEQGVRVFAVG